MVASLYFGVEKNATNGLAKWRSFKKPCTTLELSETMVCGIYRGIIMPGPLRRCRFTSIHSFAGQPARRRDKPLVDVGKGSKHLKMLAVKWGFQPLFQFPLLRSMPRLDSRASDGGAMRLLLIEAKALGAPLALCRANPNSQLAFGVHPPVGLKFHANWRELDFVQKQKPIP